MWSGFNIQDKNNKDSIFLQLDNLIQLLPNDNSQEMKNFRSLIENFKINFDTTKELERDKQLNQIANQFKALQKPKTQAENTSIKSPLSRRKTGLDSIFSAVTPESINPDVMRKVSSKKLSSKKLSKKVNVDSSTDSDTEIFVQKPIKFSDFCLVLVFFPKFYGSNLTPLSDVSREKEVVGGAEAFTYKRLGDSENILIFEATATQLEKKKSEKETKKLQELFDGILSLINSKPEKVMVRTERVKVTSNISDIHIIIKINKDDYDLTDLLEKGDINQINMTEEHEKEFIEYAFRCNHVDFKPSYNIKKSSDIKIMIVESDSLEQGKKVISNKMYENGYVLIKNKLYPSNPKFNNKEIKINEQQLDKIIGYEVRLLLSKTKPTLEALKSQQQKPPMLIKHDNSLYFYGLSQEKKEQLSEVNPKIKSFNQLDFENQRIRVSNLYYSDVYKEIIKNKYHTPSSEYSCGTNKIFSINHPDLNILAIEHWNNIYNKQIIDYKKVNTTAKCSSDKLKFAYKLAQNLYTGPIYLPANMLMKGENERLLTSINPTSSDDNNKVIERVRSHPNDFILVFLTSVFAKRAIKDSSQEYEIAMRLERLPGYMILKMENGDVIPAGITSTSYAESSFISRDELIETAQKNQKLIANIELRRNELLAYINEGIDILQKKMGPVIKNEKEFERLRIILTTLTEMKLQIAEDSTRLKLNKQKEEIEKLWSAAKQAVRKIDPEEITSRMSRQKNLSWEELKPHIMLTNNNNGNGFPELYLVCVENMCNNLIANDIELYRNSIPDELFSCNDFANEKLFNEQCPSFAAINQAIFRLQGYVVNEICDSKNAAEFILSYEFWNDVAHSLCFSPTIINHLSGDAIFSVILSCYNMLKRLNVDHGIEHPISSMTVARQKDLNTLFDPTQNFENHRKQFFEILDNPNIGIFIPDFALFKKLLTTAGSNQIQKNDLINRLKQIRLMLAISPDIDLFKASLYLKDKIYKSKSFDEVQANISIKINSLAPKKTDKEFKQISSQSLYKNNNMKKMEIIEIKPEQKFIVQQKELLLLDLYKKLYLYCDAKKIEMDSGKRLMSHDRNQLTSAIWEIEKIQIIYKMLPTNLIKHLDVYNNTYKKLCNVLLFIKRHNVTNEKRFSQFADELILYLHAQAEGESSRELKESLNRLKDKITMIKQNHSGDTVESLKKINSSLNEMILKTNAHEHQGISLMIPPSVQLIRNIENKISEYTLNPANFTLEDQQMIKNATKADLDKKIKFLNENKVTSDIKIEKKT